MAEAAIPLFPLKTVLFPGGPLPLRIFEPRYVDMVSRCLREDIAFGVVLISDGSEVGEQRICSVGTTARIRDWYQEEDGLLGIKASGEERFRVLGLGREDDGLNVATVSRLSEPPADVVAKEDLALCDLLRRALARLGDLYDPDDMQLDDAGWVSYRLAEVLPISLASRQLCLETENAVERMNMLRPVADQVMRGKQS